MTGFCDVVYMFEVDSAVGPCVNDLDLTIALQFDLFCTGATDLASVVGTSSQQTYTVTWSAELSSFYSGGTIDTQSETFDIVITNPCYDSALVEITVDTLMPDYRYYTAVDTTDAEVFDFVPFTSTGLTANTNYRETCTLTLSSIVYDPDVAAITVSDSSSPVS